MRIDDMAGDGRCLLGPTQGRCVLKHRRPNRVPGPYQGFRF